MLLALGSRDGAVVRALVSHQWRRVWAEFVAGSRPYYQGFSPGSPVFLPPQKSIFPNSNLIGDSRTTGSSVTARVFY